MSEDLVYTEKRHVTAIELNWTNKSHRKDDKCHGWTKETCLQMIICVSGNFFCLLDFKKNKSNVVVG